MARLDGKVAVITGAASGIGLEASRRFAAENATVVMVGRSQEKAKQAAAGGDRLDPVGADVTSSQDLRALRDHVEATYGKADVVFANAGIFSIGSFVEVAEADFDRMIAVNLKSVFFTVQALLPVLRDGGSVIITSSVVATRPLPGTSVYSASKAAVRSLAQSLALDLKDRRIRVNTLSPGNTETDIGIKAGFSRDALDGFLEHAAGDTPLGRNGHVDDMADAALYLASDESRFVTGIDLLVDGGFALT